MRTFESSHDFYDLPEAERVALIGHTFREKDRPGFYFPVGLSADQPNYGVRQGLVYVSPVSEEGTRKGFYVCVVSPDDLDLFLCFEGGVKRQEVLEHLRKMNKRGTTYLKFLKEIQQAFGGEIRR